MNDNEESFLKKKKLFSIFSLKDHKWFNYIINKKNEKKLGWKKCLSHMQAGRKANKPKKMLCCDEMRITRETRIWKYFFFFLLFLTFCILLHIKKYACLFDGYMSQRQQDDDDNRKQKQREKGKIHSFIPD